MAAGIGFFLTTGDGGGGIANSLGGTIGAQISSVSPNNLFDNISAPEAANGGQLGGDNGLDVRAIRIKNTGTLTLVSVKIWGGAAGQGSNSTYTSFKFGKDTNVNPETHIVANESTLPEDSWITYVGGLKWNWYLTEQDALDLGNLNVGASAMVWIVRVCDPGATAKSADTKNITVKAQYSA